MEEILVVLNGLLPQQMNDLILALNVPNQVMPPPSAPHGDRVFQILQWAKGSTGPGLAVLEQTLERIVRQPIFLSVEQPNEAAAGPAGTHDLERLRKLLLSPRKPGVAGDPSERIVYAAWRWLKPEVTLERLENLREEARLADTDMGIFARKLLEACAQLAEEHPRLTLWITRRTALLEYKIATLAELSAEPPTTEANLTEVMPDASAPHGERVSALLSWARGPGGVGLGKVQQELAKLIHPH